MIKINRHKIIKMVFTHFLEVFIKIEVKDNNVEQASQSFKKKTSKRWFFQSYKIKKYIRKTIRKEKKNSARKY